MTLFSATREGCSQVTNCTLCQTWIKCLNTIQVKKTRKHTSTKNSLKDYNNKKKTLADDITVELLRGRSCSFSWVTSRGRACEGKRHLVRTEDSVLVTVVMTS